MTTTANQVIKLAQSWIGKKESNGTHKSIIDIYNAHKPLARGYKVKYSDNWCATTVSALFIKLGATDIMPTECGCQRMIDLCKKKGILIENEAITPLAGDIIFYDWDDNGKGDNKGWSDHVGIVEKVSNGVITAIEGNKNNSVARREIKVNAKFIRGYARPKYKAEPTPTPAPKPTTSSCYKKYTGKSNRIDEVFKSIGVPSKYIGSYKKRKPIAEKNGIKNYSGTASQNLKLISLAKQGKLKKV